MISNKVSLDLTSKSKVKVLQDSLSTPVSMYFWLQRFYAGKDPINYLQQTELYNQRKYFTIGDQALYYSNTQETFRITEDQIDVFDIYDKTSDNAAEGKCCKRVLYTEHVQVKCGEKGDKDCVDMIEYGGIPGAPPTDAQLDANPYLARFCLDIMIFNQVKWRICKADKDEVLKFKMSLTYQTIKSVLKNVSDDLASKFINASTYDDTLSADYWDWHGQTKWGGRCNSKVMQSPIDLHYVKSGDANSNDLTQTTGTPAAAKAPTFTMDYKFADKVPFSIERAGVEAIIKFNNFAGGVKISNSGTSNSQYLSFSARRISFKFPGEFTVNGERPDGEMVISMQQITENSTTTIATTNGLNLVLPLRFDPNVQNNKIFDTLQVDSWKTQLDGKTSFIPVDSKSKEIQFNLDKLVKAFMDLKPDFGLVLGSNTTPPCLDYVYHLVAFSPLLISNCQFKALRENSLLTDNLKETHARKLQSNAYGTKGDQKQILFDQVKLAPSLSLIATQREMKYIQEDINFVNPNDPSNPKLFQKKKELPQDKKTDPMLDVVKTLKAGSGCNLERIVTKNISKNNKNAVSASTTKASK